MRWRVNPLVSDSCDIIIVISQGFSWGTLTNKQTNAVFSISQRSHAAVSLWAVDDGRRGLWPCTGLVVHLRQRTHSWLYVSVSKESHRSSGFWRVHSPELLLPPSATPDCHKRQRMTRVVAAYCQHSIRPGKEWRLHSCVVSCTFPCYTSLHCLSLI